MNATRARIIATTAELLELQGYQATSLGQVLDRSGAPKGSLYYYFPGGKEELVAAAVEHGARLLAELIEARMAVGDHPAVAVGSLILALAERVRVSEYRAGSVITTVALEAAAGIEQVDQACRQAYGLWQDALREGLVGANYPADDAARLAVHVVSSLEGAILLGRVARSTEPLLELADRLYHTILESCPAEAATAARPPRPPAPPAPQSTSEQDRLPPAAGWRNW